MITHVERIKTNNQIKFKTTTLKPSLCDYSDVYIFVKGRITATWSEKTEAERETNWNSKQAISKNCAPFTDCIAELNSTQVDNEKVIHVVIAMCSLIENSKNYLHRSTNLWQY